MAYPITEEQLFQKLSAMCASAEHCAHEMAEKMRRWQVSDDTAARIISRLTAERYIDEERYCRAFAHDKVEYNKWGRRKVEQALRMKRISEKVYGPVLDEIEPETYIEILRPMLQSKRKSTKANSDYELKAKLMRFALSRGFTPDIIEECL